VEFSDTLKSFDSLQFPADMRDTVLNSLVAILHLGNISFVNDEEGFSQINPASEADIAKVCSLLGLDAGTFGSALCVKSQTISGNITNIPLTGTQAVDSRNAFAKEIYGRIFSYIVYGANLSLSGRASANSLSIGLLDIFGSSDLNFVFYLVCPNFS
jgi:myosin-1